MPDEAAHKAACANHLSSYEDTVEKHPDWGATMLFYCAVHAVEQFFAAGPDPRHSCEHAERDFALKSGYSSIWKDYRVLKGESLKARYLQGGMFTLSAAQVRKKLLPRLERIRSDIASRIEARRIPGL